MPTNTTPDNILKPLSTDQVAPLAPWFSNMADSVQAAFTERFKGIPRGSAFPGLVVASDAERDLIYPAPEQGNVVYRSDKGWHEAYYGTYNAASNPGGRAPAGWAPVGSSTLPDPITVTNPNAVNITATAITNIPSLATASITLLRPAWVDVSLGAWLVATAGDLRAGVALSGATTQAMNLPSWGTTLRISSTDAKGASSYFSKTVKVNAGTTVFTGQAYQTGGGANTLSYAVMQVTPLRWA